MDIRQIDEADECIALDLLREWISTVFRRSVPLGFPPGCVWSTIVVALQHAGFSENPEDLERMIRQLLVNEYVEQGGAAVKQIIQAKFAYNSSFLQLFGPDLQRASAQWLWYLYCLCITTFEPLESGAARMKLDMVDMQVLAEKLNITIVVSQLLQRSLRFEPQKSQQQQQQPRRCIHLVHHGGQWSPVLSPRPPEREVAWLLESVVELRGTFWQKMVQQHNALGLVGPVGTVLSYDQDQDTYLVDLGGALQLVLERAHVSRVLYQIHQEEWCSAFAGVKLLDKADDSLLGGIPEKSLEWHLLHELVRREARAKLEQMMQNLAGRDVAAPGGGQGAASAVGGGGAVTGSKVKAPVPDRPELSAADAATAAAGGGGEGGASGEGLEHRFENPQDASVPHAVALELADASPFVTLRLSLDVMVQHVQAGSEISVYAVRPFAPSARGHVALDVGDEVRVVEVGSCGWVYVACESGSRFRLGRCAAEGWCPRDCLTVWEASHQFRPDDAVPERGRFLALEAGDTMVLARRYAGEWSGWGFGTRWGEKMGSGLFHLGCAEPQVLVRQWTWEI